jgi:hypothetical protein
MAVPIIYGLYLLAGVAGRVGAKYGIKKLVKNATGKLLSKHKTKELAQRTRDKIKPQTTGTSKSGVEYNTYNLTKANPTTRAVANRSRRQGRTEGAVALAVGAPEAYKLGKRIAGKNLTNQEMIREYTEALQDDGASKEEVSEKVKVFKNDFIEKGKSEVKFNKGGDSVPKPRQKPHSPIYTPEVYKKFEEETKGMSQKDTDAYIARRGRNKGGTVMKKKPVKKLAKGGFPDLTGDGKVTKKDVLKGRGVAMNMGGMKKQYGAKNYMSGGYVMGKKKK